ncbi:MULTISPECIES: oligosaccharide flippase family protein [Cupriavidus]|uniref:oligosaccharide flippase family protein n=1 Tax=Cupriavidus sp. 30B13 TaxID=3384241 RepID=UPI003B910BFC
MKNVLRRLGWRLFWSALATVLAFAMFQPLALATGVPEVAAVLPALAVVYWVEMSVLVMRVALHPRLDFQDIARDAVASSTAGVGAAIVFAVLSMGVLARMGVILWIVYGAR